MTAITDCIDEWRRQAAIRGFRLVVLWECPPDTDIADIKSRLAHYLRARSVLVADGAIGDRQPLARPNEVLGTENDTVLWLPGAGVSADLLGAAVGSLVAGGLLLCCNFSLSLQPPFCRRAIDLLKADPAVAVVGDVLRHPVWPSADAISPPVGMSQDAAVETLEKLLQKRRPPVVLRSPRGCGKSAAFGIAAAKAMRQKPLRIGLVAHRPDAVERAFHHAAKALGLACPAQRLEYGGGELFYLAPDRALTLQDPPGIILVDEAAALPAALLEGLLTRYPRLAFATTTEGYEGNGRGFEQRFVRQLQRAHPDWRWLDMDRPLRWQSGDPLTALLNRILLSASVDVRAERHSAADNAGDNAGDSAGAVTGSSAEGFAAELEVLDSSGLADNEPLLVKIAGLMTEAHYQTRPSDFQRVLDDPTVTVLVARQRDALCGVLLLIEEGGLAPDLCKAIHAGRRRPPGELLAQTLIYYGDQEKAGEWRGLRVWRIAVTPSSRRQGIGRALLVRAEQLALQRGLHYLGSSFAMEGPLLGFWHRAGFTPIRVGTRRDNSTGSVALQVLRPLTEGSAGLGAAMHRQLAQDLPLILRDALREMPPALAFGLLRAVAVEGVEAEAMLQRYAKSECHWELAQPAVWRWLATGGALKLGERQGALALARILQGHSWQHCAESFGYSGRKECEAALRQVLSSAIEMT